MMHEARDEKCPPPYYVERPAEVKAVVANRLREALHMAAQANDKKGKRRQ